MLPVVFGLLLAGAPVSADPLGKVYELMNALETKIKAEGEAEAKAFSEYVEWCDDAAANLRNEIKTGEGKQEELTATISKCKADIEAASVKIEDLSGAISADENSSRRPQLSAPRRLLFSPPARRNWWMPSTLWTGPSVSCKRRCLRAPSWHRWTLPSLTA
jgi:septal ring factor EnvC (AmiA/AmiB activator)